MRDVALSDELADFGGDASARRSLKDFLVDKGYVWQDTAAHDWTAGIPSLMDYMVAETEAG